MQINKYISKVVFQIKKKEKLWRLHQKTVRSNKFSKEAGCKTNTHKKVFHLHTLIMNYQKEKLRKQSHLQLDQLE